MTWIVEFQGETFGPFEDEDACYAFAATVSEEPNDWTPIEFREPRGAMGRLERFVASDGDVEVLLEGLPDSTSIAPAREATPDYPTHYERVQDAGYDGDPKGYSVP